jgi:hypothetical protein
MSRVVDSAMSHVMDTVMAAAIASDMRAGSRDVSDPWGRGLDQSPGRRGGSLTSRMQYTPGFPVGKKRRPTVTDAAGAVATNLLRLRWLPPSTPSIAGPPHRSIRRSVAGDTRTTPLVGFVPLFVRR